MKILIMILTVLGASLTSGLAQSSSPFTMNAAGGSGTASGYKFDWSVGEMTLVSTFNASGIVVTQGVLQPFDGPTGIANTKLLSDLKVFPNPATAAVNVQYTWAGPGVISYRLIDMAGRIITTSTLDAKPGTNTEQVSLASLAAASYMLEVSFTSVENITEHASYIIQKLQ